MASLLLIIAAVIVLLHGSIKLLIDKKKRDQDDFFSNGADNLVCVLDASQEPVVDCDVFNRRLTHYYVNRFLPMNLCKRYSHTIWRRPGTVTNDDLKQCWDSMGRPNATLVVLHTTPLEVPPGYDGKIVCVNLEKLMALWSKDAEYNKRVFQ